MKKVLLGTTALVAAGAFAGIGAAQAQDMMVGMQPLELGGYYTLAGISTDADGRGHSIQQNIELEGRAVAELDNAITAGIRVRIAGNNHTMDNVSETEVFFTGSFGGIHAGQIEPASQQMTIWSPGGTVPIGSIKSPWFGGIGGMWTSANHWEDSNKIVYFSPSFNGISLGVSYSPDPTHNNYGGEPPFNATNDDDGEHGEQVTAAVSYGSDLMGGSFNAMIGLERTTTESMGGVACAEPMLCDPEGLRYGLSLSIDDIAVGAAVYEHDSGGDVDMDTMMRSPLGDTTKTDIGASWTQGPLMLGVQYASNEDASGGEATSTSLNLNYNLGGGVDLGAVYATGDNADGSDYTNVLLGTMFNF